MSIYDQRETSAYGPLPTQPSYAKNPYILKWWTPQLDQLLAEQIAQKQ